VTVTTSVDERLVVSHEWDIEYYHLLQRKLRGFNRRMATFMEPPDALPLNIRVVNREGATVGGMAALTYWGWLVIKFLVIDDEFRGNGLGQRLIECAHSEAKRRGCTRSHTATYDFQALTYYKRYGYRVVGELADYPEGYNYYWLRKDFEEPYAPSDDASPDPAVIPVWPNGL
jgi:GNAT superfamily N-acetyltransferase